MRYAQPTTTPRATEDTMTLPIATSYHVGDTVRASGRTSVRFVSDALLVGPCTTDLHAHLRMRADFWADDPPQEQAMRASYRRALAALDSAQPVLVWTSPSWNDRVALWALCSYRLERWPEQPSLSLICVGTHDERDAELSFGIGEVTLVPAMITRDLHRTARPLSLRQIREKARFWKRLSSPCPILGGKPRRETSANKELLELGAYQAGFFPRQTKQTGRGLSLSTLDSLLFASVNDTPSSPAEILGRENATSEELWRWMHLTGDIPIFKRLAQWTEHGALAAKPWTAPNGWETAKYSFTDLGHSLLQDGLTSLTQAPPFPIWGVTGYDPHNPWVVVDEAGKWPHLRRPA